MEQTGPPSSSKKKLLETPRKGRRWFGQPVPFFLGTPKKSNVKKLNETVTLATKRRLSTSQKDDDNNEEEEKIDRNPAETENLAASELILLERLRNELQDARAEISVLKAEKKKQQQHNNKTKVSSSSRRNLFALPVEADNASAPTVHEDVSTTAASTDEAEQEQEHTAKHHQEGDDEPRVPISPTNIILLRNAERQAQTYKTKLTQTEEMLEALQHDMDNARRTVHTLVSRNMALASHIKRMRVHQEDHMILRSSLVKSCIYSCPVFLLWGGIQIFMATITIIWLLIELEAYVLLDDDDDDETRHHGKNSSNSTPKEDEGLTTIASPAKGKPGPVMASPIPKNIVLPIQSPVSKI